MGRARNREKEKYRDLSLHEAAAFLRWLCPIVVVVVILAMSPGAALAAAKPGAPTGLTATAGNGQVSLTWNAPANDGGDPITDYRVQYRKAGALTWMTFPDGGGNDTTATVKPLVNGTSYEFRVKAKNAVGLGAAVQRRLRHPGRLRPRRAGGPDRPDGDCGERAGDPDLDCPLGWRGPITDYRVQYRERR